MLAMLFEMTSTLSCWANMPVAAMLSERIALILSFFVPYAVVMSASMASRIRWCSVSARRAAAW